MGHIKMWDVAKVLIRGRIFFKSVCVYVCTHVSVKKTGKIIQISTPFELWCWRRLLRVSWTARRSNQSILNEIRMVVHWKD